MNKRIFLLLIVSCLLLTGCFSDKKKEGSVIEKEAVVETILASDVKKIVDDYTSYPDIDIIDVRTEEEFNEGHIKGAINIPVERIKEINISTDREIIVYCRSGRRSHDAAEILVELGYKNVKDMGGIIDWEYELQKS